MPTQSFKSALQNNVPVLFLLLHHHLICFLSGAKPCFSHWTPMVSVIMLLMPVQSATLVPITSECIFLFPPSQSHAAQKFPAISPPSLYCDTYKAFNNEQPTNTIWWLSVTLTKAVLLILGAPHLPAPIVFLLPSILFPSHFNSYHCRTLAQYGHT